MVTVIGHCRAVGRRHLLLWCVLLLGCAGCGDSGSSNAITFEVDLRAGQSWIASGDPVTGGTMCEAGSRRFVGYLDADGTPLTIGEAIGRMQAVQQAENPDQAVDFLLVVEWTCRNGSGSFTVVEEPRPGGSWETIEGSGAYASVRMAGSSAIEEPELIESPDTPQDLQEILVLAGSIEIDR